MCPITNVEVSHQGSEFASETHYSKSFNNVVGTKKSNFFSPLTLTLISMLSGSLVEIPFPTQETYKAHESTTIIIIPSLHTWDYGTEMTKEYHVAQT